jgi:RNA-directed DNA polymerase
MQLSLFPQHDRNQILTDLFQAYYDARRNKRNTKNALKFEINYESNLLKLGDEIISGNYRPLPSICFIVNKPVKREIFAADFCDRVIHHFIFNHISPVFEKYFIHDSYSCRKQRGTHYGIQRISKFIRSCSENYKQDCYILKLDIKGYFMAINKDILFQKVKSVLFRQQHALDFNLQMELELIEKTIFNDPVQDCRIKGKNVDWGGLPKSKSLFHSARNCGLPIGNLTSQLFSNVYLNVFDHYVKNELGIKHYGRYVDDFVIVHQNKDYLKSLIPKIRDYLKKELHLELHPNKIYLQHFSKGVKFLGVIIKPYRLYIANRTKGNFYRAIQEQNKIARDHSPRWIIKSRSGSSILENIQRGKPTKEEQAAFLSIINSYLGILNPCKSSREHAPLSLWRGAAGEAKMQYKTYKLRKRMIRRDLSAWWENYFYAKGYAKMVAKQKIRKRKHSGK